MVCTYGGMTGTYLALVALLALAAGGLLFWLFRPKNAKRLDHDARLPLDDGGEGG